MSNATYRTQLGRPRDRRSSVARWLTIGLTSLVIAGCGDRLATVSGVVTLDGQPLACDEDLHGLIQFYPEGGTGAVAVGHINEQGRYSLSTGSRPEVQPGSYVVTISATEIIPSASPGEAPSGRPATPRRYADPKQSDWHVDVKPGDNTFNFNLESHP